MTHRFAFCLVVCCLLIAASAWAQEPVTAEPIAQEPMPAGLVAADVEGEPGFAEAVLAATTDPAFLPENVATLPDSDTAPSPTDHLGHIAGAPDVLSSVAEVHGYFRELAAASPRVEIETLGTSEEGREMMLVSISSEDNLARAGAIREAGRRLADPRQTTPAERDELIADGPAVYYLLGGLHSRETGSPEMLMELAYRLAVSERPEIVRMRDKLVVLITPVVEPDGRDRVVEWYRRHLKGRDMSWEDVAEIGGPPYWGKYVYHDNNRDGMQRTQALTRAVHDAFYRWRPQVVHDLHESVPLLYISTGHGPYSPAVDPVTINEWTQMAHHEASALQAQGLPGVWVWGFWDGWWPGYLVSVAHHHHAVGRFYETFGNSHPGTFERDLSKARFVGKKVTETTWYRPWPPEDKVTWSLRNNTNYMQAGVLAALDYAALHAEQLKGNQWRKAQRAIEQGGDEAPHAWVLPVEGQRDGGRLADLVNLLRQHQIEVHRLAEAVTFGETTHGTGSYVVRLDQPARNAAQNFLEAQSFPKNEPNPPYDDVAWTWPLLMGVEATAVEDPAVLQAAMAPVTAPVQPAGGIAGSDYGSDLYLLADRGQTSLLRARLYWRGYQIDAAEEPFDADGRQYPVGSWIIQAPRDVVEPVAVELGLEVQPAFSMPEVRRHVVDLPRLGVIHTWTRTQEAGWARYTLDRQGLTYDLVSPDDLRRGDLLDRFDVLLLPPVGRSLARIVHGIDRRWSPLAYTETADFPSHGRPNASDDITGGMGFEGLANLQDFVRRGGLLATLGNGAILALDGGLVRRVSRSSTSVRNPGSELSARLAAADHPLVYGYPERTSVFRGNGLLLEVDKRERQRVVMRFGDEPPEEAEEPEEEIEIAEVEDEILGEDLALDEAVEEAAVAAPQPMAEEEKEEEPRPLVLSGYVDSPDKLAGKAAIVDLPVGQGRVVMYGFNPLHRHLNTSDFRFLFNLLLHWNDLPE